MAINFPNNPSNGQQTTVGGVRYEYNSSKNAWKKRSIQISAASGSGTTILADMAALIARTGMSNGDQAYVQSNNNLYFYESGWYKIATVSNDSPSAITGVNSSYDLEVDGTATVITAVSTDPEGFPLTWSYSITSGSLGTTATVSQSGNVFTITPGTNNPADAGSFGITFSASDGINIANSSATFTLEFTPIVLIGPYNSFSGGSPFGINQAHGDGPEAAIDNSTSTHWHTSNTSGSYWGYDFGAGNSVTVTRYRLMARSSNVSHNMGTWNFQGSNDGTNYTTLHSVSAFNGWLKPPSGSPSAYDSYYINFDVPVGNRGSYRYYRIVNLANSPGDSYFYQTIGSLEFLGFNI